MHFQRECACRTSYRKRQLRGMLHHFSPALTTEQIVAREPSGTRSYDHVTRTVLAATIDHAACTHTGRTGPPSCVHASSCLHGTPLTPPLQVVAPDGPPSSKVAEGFVQWKMCTAVTLSPHLTKRSGFRSSPYPDTLLPPTSDVRLTPEPRASVAARFTALQRVTPSRTHIMIEILRFS